MQSVTNMTRAIAAVLTLTIASIAQMAASPQYPQGGYPEPYPAERPPQRGERPYLVGRSGQVIPVVLVQSPDQLNRRSSYPVVVLGDSGDSSGFNRWRDDNNRGQTGRSRNRHWFPPPPGRFQPIPSQETGQPSRPGDHFPVWGPQPTATEKETTTTAATPVATPTLSPLFQRQPILPTTAAAPVATTAAAAPRRPVIDIGVDPSLFGDTEPTTEVPFVLPFAPVDGIASTDKSGQPVTPKDFGTRVNFPTCETYGCASGYKCDRTSRKCRLIDLDYE